VPSFGYAGLNALRTFAALVVSSSVAGGVVAFQLALSFYYVPVAIGARPVSTALLPRLSRLFNHRAFQAFGTELGRGTRLVFFLTMPVTVFYVVLGGTIADAVLFGSRASESAALVAIALMTLAPGVIGESSFVLSTQACYAAYDPVTPFHAMCLRTAISVSGMAVALALTDPATVLGALGVAVSLGNLISAWQLHHHLARRLGESSGLAGAIVRDLAVSLVMAAGAYLTAAGITAAAPGDAGQLLALLAALPVAAVVFVLGQRALNCPELMLLRGSLRQMGGSA
jgi:putative peptidoglycan lipid II flippase